MVRKIKIGKIVISNIFLSMNMLNGSDLRFDFGNAGMVFFLKL